MFAFTGSSIIKGNTAVVWRYLTFTQNLGSLPFFEASWSLCVEEHFYLLFPILVLAFAKREMKMGGWIFPLIIIGGLILRFSILIYGQHNHLLDNRPASESFFMYQIYYRTYCRLDSLTMGVALAAIRYYRPNLWERLLECGNPLLFGGGTILVLTLLMNSTGSTAFSVIAIFPLTGISFALNTASAISPQSILGRIKLRGVTWLAELAYSIYLTHFLALSVAHVVISKWRLDAFRGLSFIVTMALIVSLAVALFLLVERPFLNLRDRLFIGSRVREASDSALHRSLTDVKST